MKAVASITICVGMHLVDLEGRKEELVFICPINHDSYVRAKVDLELVLFRKYNKVDILLAEPQKQLPLMDIPLLIENELLLLFCFFY